MGMLNLPQLPLAAEPSWGLGAFVFGPLLLFALAIAGRRFRHRQTCGRSGRGVFSALTMAAIACGFGVLLFRYRQSPPPALWASPARRAAGAIESPTAEPSLDAMWDHLTEGRIAIEPPAAPTAPAFAISAVPAASAVAPPTEAEAPAAAPQATASSLAEMQQSLTKLRSVLDAATKMAEKLAALKGLSESSAAPTNSLAATSVGDAPAERRSAAAVETQLVSTTPKVSLPELQSAAPTPPAWINDPQKLLGDSRKVILKAGPFATTQECRRDLETQLSAAAVARLRSLAVASGGNEPKIPDLGVLGLSPTELLDNVYRDDYVETIDTSVGDMQQARLLVEFTPEVDKRLLAAWQDRARVDGMRRVGGIASLVMSGLALAYGLLKVDTWTRGYYTKRLFLGVPAGIIALVALLRQIG